MKPVRQRDDIPQILKFVCECMWIIFHGQHIVWLGLVGYAMLIQIHSRVQKHYFAKL